MAKLIDLAGQKFGRLTVISYARKDKEGNILWNCLCDCGNTKIILRNNLKSGHTQSCGCYKIEVVTNHGHAKSGNKSPTYHSWCGVITRCINPNHKNYMDYGGRGITVCERWSHSFKNFLEDMGERPKGMSIDRINNDGNYYKENCKWSTITEQNRNMRNNVRLTFNGKIKLQADWAKEWEINPVVISYNIRKGHSMEWIYENKVNQKEGKFDDSISIGCDSYSVSLIPMV